MRIDARVQTGGKHFDARIQRAGPARVTYGHGLKYEDGVLSVDCAEAVEQDNTLPVTAAAVYVELGNVEALLAAL